MRDVWRDNRELRIRGRRRLGCDPLGGDGIDLALVVMVVVRGDGGGGS